MEMDNINRIYLFNLESEEYEILELSDLELLASEKACQETSLSLAELVHTPQYKDFIASVNQNCSRF